MNSGNHVMLVGDLAIWLYEYLAGIRPDDLDPGFKQIVMRPAVVEGLDWVKASHRSPYGLIESSWQKKGAAFEWQITIPPGSTATVSLLAADPSSAKESGGPLSKAKGVEVVGVKDGRIDLRLESGKYQFESEL
jgi:alpha-L-rhamnosidase